MKIDRLALKISAIVLVTLALITLGPLHEAAAQAGCPSGNARSTPAWQAFEKIVERDYVQAGDLRPSSLSPQDWAIVLGHALGRQAPAVGDNEDNRAAFDCLEVGIQEVLVKGLIFSVPNPQQVSNGLYRRVLESAMGMHDARVEELTGMAPDAPIATIFDVAKRDAGPDTAKPDTREKEEDRVAHAGPDLSSGWLERSGFHQSNSPWGHSPPEGRDADLVLTVVPYAGVSCWHWQESAYWCFGNSKWKSVLNVAGGGLAEQSVNPDFPWSCVYERADETERDDGRKMWVGHGKCSDDDREFSWNATFNN